MESAIGGAFHFVRSATKNKNPLGCRLRRGQYLGTHTLFCYIGTSLSGRWVVTRQFSVVPHFQPGGNVQFYGQLPPVAQLGLQQQLMQLNHALGGVARNLWALSSCWNTTNPKNFVFMLQCLPTARTLAADKGAFGASLTHTPHIRSVFEGKNRGY